MKKRINFSGVLSKRIWTLLVAMVLACALLTSCMGTSTTSKAKIAKDVTLDETSALTQSEINEIANFLLNNYKAYESFLAAYRGYYVKDEAYKDIKPGDVFEQKEINLDAAKLVLEDYDNQDTEVALNYENINAADVKNIVENLQSTVTFDAEKGVLGNIMYGIGVALGWFTNTLGFGNYIVGIIIFALILEIILLPMGIKRQKNSIKQAKLRPKEMAIRKKYAGRNDQVTMQKMQSEIQEMYRKENFNPASGCLPLLIQLPIIMVLYNIVVDPLTYVIGKAGSFASGLQAYYTASPLAGGLGGTLSAQNGKGSIEVLSKIKEMGLESFEGLKSFPMFGNGETVYNEVAGVYDQIPSFNIGSSVNLGYVPSIDSFNWLLLIPVLTFVIYFGSMKLTKKFAYQPVVNESQQAGCSSKIMDITMPLMSVFFCFMVPAVIGVYWMVKSVFSTLEQFILSKLMPLPQFTEEDFKAAEREMGVRSKKGGSKSERDPNAPRPRSLHYIDDEDYEVSDNTTATAKTPDVKASETPVGAAPLKLDEPERKSKKAQKEETAEEAAEEAVEEPAEEVAEEAAEEPAEEAVAEESAETETPAEETEKNN